MQVGELWSVHDQEALAAFEVGIRNGDLAGALLAIEGASAAGSSDCRDEVRRLGHRIRSVAAQTDPATAMVRVLVEEEGFTGDQEDYYQPRNSYLSSVLERRRGIPILLSSVWMLAGEQAGVAVDGVALPGRFIVRVGGAAGVLVDPFGSGVMLSQADCARLVDAASSGTVPWTDTFLVATSLDGVAERVLHNLLNTFQKTSELEMIFRTVRFFAALRTNDAEPRLIHAQIAESVGARDLALALYASLLDSFPGTAAADKAGERLIALRGEPPELN